MNFFETDNLFKYDDFFDSQQDIYCYFTDAFTHYSW